MPPSPPGSACPGPRCHCIALWAAHPLPWPSPESHILWAGSPGSDRSLCSHPEDKAWSLCICPTLPKGLGEESYRVGEIQESQIAGRIPAAAPAKFRSNSDLRQCKCTGEALPGIRQHSPPGLLASASLHPPSQSLAGSMSSGKITGIFSYFLTEAPQCCPLPSVYY